MSSWTFTSESVTEGHPDKMADQISDAILDAMLDAGPDEPRRLRDLRHHRAWPSSAARSRPTATSTSRRSSARRSTSIGYDRESYGYDGNTVGVIVSLDEQSPDIAQGVDDSEEVRSGTSGEDLLNKQGAGDQGMMFGYACDETDDAHAAADPPRAPHGRAAGRGAPGRAPSRTCAPTARPRSPSTTTTASRSRLRTVLISTQHNDGIDRDEVIRPDLIEHVIRPVVPAQFADDDYERVREPDRSVRDRRPVRRRRPHRSQDHRRHLRRHGPPRRRRLLGQGPVQGRPLGRLRGPLGGQERGRRRAPPAAARCRSPTPSAWPTRCRSWSRRSAPRRSTTPAIVDAVTQVFDLRPAAIVRDLDLRRPIYKRTAAYGHFGRAAGTAASPGSAPTRSTTCARRSGSDPPVPDPPARVRRPERVRPPNLCRRVTRWGHIAAQVPEWGAGRAGAAGPAGHRQDLRLPRRRALDRRHPGRHHGPGRAARPPGRGLGGRGRRRAAAGRDADPDREGDRAGDRRPTWSTWPSGRPGAGPADRPRCCAPRRPTPRCAGSRRPRRPPRAVTAPATGQADDLARAALARPRSVVRLAPAADPYPIVLAACGRGQRPRAGAVGIGRPPSRPAPAPGRRGRRRSCRRTGPGPRPGHR